MVMARVPDRFVGLVEMAVKKGASVVVKVYLASEMDCATTLRIWVLIVSLTATALRCRQNANQIGGDCNLGIELVIYVASAAWTFVSV